MSAWVATQLAVTSAMHPCLPTYFFRRPAGRTVIGLSPVPQATESSLSVGVERCPRWCCAICHDCQAACGQRLQITRTREPKCTLSIRLHGRTLYNLSYRWLLLLLLLLVACLPDTSQQRVRCCKEASGCDEATCNHNRQHLFPRMQWFDQRSRAARRTRR